MCVCVCVCTYVCIRLTTKGDVTVFTCGMFGVCEAPRSIFPTVRVPAIILRILQNTLEVTTSHFSTLALTFIGKPRLTCLAARRRGDGSLKTSSQFVSLTICIWKAKLTEIDTNDERHKPQVYVGTSLRKSVYVYIYTEYTHTHIYIYIYIYIYI